MAEAGASSHGWCSLRLRFDERELELLRNAERLRGAEFARSAGPTQLRTALSLAKAGQKVGRGVPGGNVTLEESELSLLLDAVRFAAREVPLAGHAGRAGDADAPRGDAVLLAFPELVEKGAWRSFGLARELEGLAARLDSSLRGSTSTS